MLNHRLVPDDTPDFRTSPESFLGVTHYYLKNDTTPITSEWTAEQLVELAKITPEEWYKIGQWFLYSGESLDLFQSISDLISLAISGLTVEEIKALKELKL